MRPARTLLLTLSACALLCAAAAHGQDPTPGASPKPTPSRAAPAPSQAAPRGTGTAPVRSRTHGADPFRAQRRRAGAVTLAQLPSMELRGMVRVRGRDPHALIAVRNRVQVVKVGSRLTLTGETGVPLKLVVEEIALGRIRLVHAQSGETLEVR